MSGKSEEPTVVIENAVGKIVIHGERTVFMTKKDGFHAVGRFAGRLDSKTLGNVLYRIVNSDLPSGRPPIVLPPA